METLPMKKIIALIKKVIKGRLIKGQLKLRKMKLDY